MKTFKDLEFKKQGGKKVATAEFVNRFAITIVKEKLLPLYLVTATGPTIKSTDDYTEGSGRRALGYPTCTRDKVDYLMRLLQTDPEKVMTLDC